MQLCDTYTIANFVPGLKLMYRAAMGVFKAYHWQGSTAIVVGYGNNGGDGFAFSWILQEKGFDCAVFTLSQKLSPDSAYYAEKVKEAGVPVRPFEAGALNGFDTVWTACWTRILRHCQRQILTCYRSINASNAFVISVDINSGMNGDSGEVELVVRSVLTVTIGYVKKGLVIENAGNYIKRLVCTDICIVLVQEEGFITDETCPVWLDRNVISSQ